MRIAKCIGMMLLTLCLLVNTALAETLVLSDYSLANPELESFKTAHPGLTVRTDGKIYNSHNDLIYDLVNGTMTNDVVDSLTSSFIDVRAIMDKGYFADLSGSDYLMEQVMKMYQPIQELIMRDGKLYAIPLTVTVELYCYDPDGWALAGFTEADVPDSFPALLDFLEAWCDRIEDDPMDDVSVCNRFDEEVYDKATYTEWLAQTLLSQQVLECQYAGKPLRFDDDFLALLKRVQAIGQRLYQLEPKQKGSYGLLVGKSFFLSTENREHTISLRLSEDSPNVFSGYVHMVAVSARSEQQELAVAYLEELMHGLRGELPEGENLPEYLKNWTRRHLAHGEKFFRGTQAVETSRETLKRFAQELEKLEAQLAGGELTGDMRVAAEDRRDGLRETLEHPLEAELWYLSPEEAAWWQENGDSVYYPGPGPFAPNSDAYQNVQQLVSQFAYGQLNAEQLCAEMDKLAQMIELERQ